MIRSTCITLLLAAGLFAQTQIDLTGQQSYVFGPAATPSEELPGVRHSYKYAMGGDGSQANPWTFLAGNPWMDAIADGGQTVVLVPGYYMIDSCPAIVPDSVTIWGTNRNQVHLRSRCTAYSVIKVADNAKHVHLRGFTLLPQSSKVAVPIIVTGSESVIEEIMLYGHQGLFDRTAVLPTSNGSGSITFDGPNNPNDTIELEMTGGASRSSAPYTVLTLPTALQPDVIAATLESHLNTLSDFQRDYYAAADGATIHLMERRFLGAPGTFAVTTSVPHTLTPWAATGRGGNTGILVTNAFSSKFSRIFCGPVYKQFHCITLAGLNNQLSFRDIRHSGGNLAGWGLRTAPGVVIQTVNVDTMTVEAAYGGLDLANLTSSSITGLYMEAAQEFGVRIQDWSTSTTGFSFNHANTIRTSRLFGSAGLVMGKGRDITVENSIIEGDCLIAANCENCTVRSSYAPECTVLSNSGYLQNHSSLGSSSRPVDRYGSILSTDGAALLGRPLTNYIIESEDFTAYEAGFAQNVIADDPFGVAGQISRASIQNPMQWTWYALGAYLQSQPLLQPDTTYLRSVWMRVVTPGARCQANLQVNRPIVIDAVDGWVRVAAPVRTNATGLVSTNVGCKLLTPGLSTFEFEGWGHMISDLQTDGALPPYVPTSGTAVTVPQGFYLYNGSVTSGGTFAIGTAGL